MTLASRIISGLLAFLMFHSSAFGFDGNNGAENDNADGKTVTVTVAKDGGGDYATLEEARDYVRTLDKTKYSGIDIVVGAGEYAISETFTLTSEDSGTEDCPVRYIGEDGSVLTGGIRFSYSDFSPLGDGEVVKYFPEDVKDKLVQIDLKQFGFTPEEVKTMVKIGNNAPVSPLYCNGEKMTVARFPNDVPGTTDGWARIKYGHVEVDDSVELVNIKDYKDVVTTIEFDETYNKRVHSWHDIYDGLICGRFTYLWFLDNTFVKALCPEKPIMQVQYSACGYEPREGMIFYWYHIPEELDIPGEYYIDKDCVLYFYPPDGHEDAVFAMPHLNDNLITIDGAEYITIENLTVEACRGDGIHGETNHVTVKDCTIQSIVRNGVYLEGKNITVRDNIIHSTGMSGVRLIGGGEETLTHADNFVTNNYISDWSNVRGAFEYAIKASGCGLTVSHNEICHSVDWGIEIGGVDVLVEYNHIYDVARFEGDQAVIHVCTTFGGIVRYNYIHDAGFNDDYIDFMGIAGIDSDYPVGQVETYGNIVANVTGSGHLIPGSRIADVHDNLYISCRRGALNYTDQNYSNVLRGVSDGKCELEDYMTSDLWLERFPFLRDLITEVDTENLEELEDIDSLDPNYWFVPADSSVRNNYVYIDKANLADPGKGITNPYIYWELCAKFSEIAEPTNDEITVYSSKRNGHPDIEEALERAAGTINLPYGEFLKIGIEK